jgi:hypothetical protein
MLTVSAAQKYQDAYKNVLSLLLPLALKVFCNCFSLPVDCHKSQLWSVPPLRKTSARNWSSASTNSACSQQLSLSLAKTRLQQSRTAFHFTSFSWAIPPSSADGDVGRDVGASSGKDKKICERKIVLKRGQGLWAKRTSSCLLAN